MTRARQAMTSAVMWWLTIALSLSALSGCPGTISAIAATVVAAIMSSARWARHRPSPDDEVIACPARRPTAPHRAARDTAMGSLCVRTVTLVGAGLSTLVVGVALSWPYVVTALVASIVAGGAEPLTVVAVLALLVGARLFLSVTA